jgi:hypothetical protein
MDDTCCSMPNDCDVLCGQSSLARNHPGNVFFRQLVLSKADDYGRARRKAQKGVIVSEILEELERNQVRFMKFNQKENHWVIIAPMIAREKVSHAIRDRVRERKSKIRASTNTNLMIANDANADVKVTPTLQEPTSNTANQLVSPSSSEETCVMINPPPCSSSNAVGADSRNVEGLEQDDDAFTLHMTSSPHGDHHIVSEDDNASFSSDVSYNTAWLMSSSSMPRPEFVSFPCYSASTPLPPPGDPITSAKNMMIANLHQHQVTMLDDVSSADIDDYNDLMLIDMMANNYQEIALVGDHQQQEDTEFMLSLLYAACSSMCHFSDDGR